MKNCPNCGSSKFEETVFKQLLKVENFEVKQVTINGKRCQKCGYVNGRRFGSKEEKK